jgi:hypothetical protein
VVGWRWRTWSPWAACIAGAIPVERYRDLLTEAGFVGVSIETDRGRGPAVNANIKARKPGV